MQVNLTLHPTYKRTADGYVPMITIRGERGRMIGSKTPQGDARYFRTFTCPSVAEIEARVIALRVSARFSGMRVA